MVAIPVVVEDRVPPGTRLGVDRALLARALAERRPWLRISALADDVLLLGRHHPPPAPPAAHRRLSGGRVVPAGAGFVQVALALPHRSALVSDDPHALRGEQVLNRAVRGILGGLEALGLDPVYPGRDLVTVRGKPIAWISLTVEEGGATLFEAGVSVGRDLSLLAPLADRIDPSGLVPVTLWQADDVTSVARELRGSTAGFQEVALAIVEGYRRRFGWETEMHGSPAVTDVGAEADDDRWWGTAGGAERPAMLGVVRAFVRTGGDGRLERVRLGGDLIAPAATMTAIEHALEGETVAHAQVRARTEAVLADPTHFLLGANARDVAAVVLAAAGR
jgi:hypothetical protein